MADFEKYLEEQVNIEELIIPSTKETKFLVEDSESTVIIKKKSNKPSELFIIRLFIDDYEELEGHDLICESESQLKLHCPDSKWSLSFEGEKIYFYSCIDDNGIDSFVIKIIE